MTNTVILGDLNGLNFLSIFVGKSIAFFYETQNNIGGHIHAPTLAPINAHTPYPYEHIQETEPADWVLRLTNSP